MWRPRTQRTVPICVSDVRAIERTGRRWNRMNAVEILKELKWSSATAAAAVAAAACSYHLTGNVERLPTLVRL